MANEEFYQTLRRNEEDENIKLCKEYSKILIKIEKEKRKLTFRTFENDANKRRNVATH